MSFEQLNNFSDYPGRGSTLDYIYYNLDQGKLAMKAVGSHKESADASSKVEFEQLPSNIQKLVYFETVFYTGKNYAAQVAKHSNSYVSELYSNKEMVKKIMWPVIEGTNLYAQALWQENAPGDKFWHKIGDVLKLNLFWSQEYCPEKVPNILNNLSIFERSNALFYAEPDPNRAVKILENQIFALKSFIKKSNLDVESNYTLENSADIGGDDRPDAVKRKIFQKIIDKYDLNSQNSTNALKYADWQNNLGELYSLLGEILLDSNPKESKKIILTARNAYSNSEIMLSICKAYLNNSNPSLSAQIEESRAKALSNMSFTYLLEIYGAMGEYGATKNEDCLKNSNNLLYLYRNKLKAAKLIFADLPREIANEYLAETKRRELEQMIVKLVIKTIKRNEPLYLVKDLDLFKTNLNLEAASDILPAELTLAHVKRSLDVAINAAGVHDDKLLLELTKSRLEKLLRAFEKKLNPDETTTHTEIPQNLLETQTSTKIPNLTDTPKVAKIQ